MRRAATIVFAGLILAAPLARGEGLSRPDALLPGGPLAGCAEFSTAGAPPAPDPLLQRMLDYAQFAVKHRVQGLASYYSSFFDGRRTANGEIYRNARYSAAHLTLPLGTWIEVSARATGRKLRMRVNDRGPYAKKFCLDLSRAAAHYLGIDVTEDRHVDIRIVALPGEEPLPDELAAGSLQLAGDEAASAGGSQLAARRR
jgi:peptidoglycan lytic transglycosylase